MIKIITRDSDNGKYEGDTNIQGSALELIRLALIYGIAIRKWESRHEDK